MVNIGLPRVPTPVPRQQEIMPASTSLNSDPRYARRRVQF